jgi:large subunit ribosomal protein L10
MARPEKVAVVEEIKEKLESAEAVFVTEYRGLTVGQQQELRRSLTKAEAEYKVFKMSLARLAAEEAGFTDLLVWLEGPTALAFTTSDPVPAAKSLKEFSDANDSLVLKGGMLSGATLDADAVRQLAAIEPREVLLAKLAGAMSAPMTKLAGLMSAILRQPATAMQQLLEKKESEPQPAVADEAPVAKPDTDTEEEAAAEQPPDDSDQDAVDEPAAEVEAEPEVEADSGAEEDAAVEEPTAEAAEETAEEAVADAEAEEPAEAAEEAASDGEAVDEDPEDSDK